MQYINILPNHISGWVQVDLLSQTQVTGFIIQHRGDLYEYVKALYFKWSNDGTTWTNAESGGLQVNGIDS